MELFDPGNAIFWRAMERLINVLIGGLSIVLGYRLFMNLPEKREPDEGKMKLLLPGDISIYVSRVGPGVFFALFGTAIVLSSFVNNLSIHKQPTDGEQSGPTESISFVADTIDNARLDSERAMVLRNLHSLRKLEANLGQSLDDGSPLAIDTEEQASLLASLPAIKGELLLRVWNPQWGDRDAFASWLHEGALPPLPAGLKQVDRFFQPLSEGGAP